MDATQDLILGVLSGPQYVFQYPGIEAYVVSIKRSGFKGRKVMLVWNINPLTRETLLNFGFEVVDVEYPSDPFFHARMRLCSEYMKIHKREFRYVFFIDIKDLILQSDPSVWMEENIKENSLIASTECVTIEQEETNQMWAKHILGEDKYQEIKDSEVINGGAWAGKSEAMAEVFDQVNELCKLYGGPYPPCQISINYVMHTALKKDTYIPRWSESFAACLHPMWSPWRTPCSPYLRDLPPVLDLDTAVLYPGMGNEVVKNRIVFNNIWGKTKSHIFMDADTGGDLDGIACVHTPSVKPFSIVHGYDRDWDLKELFEFKYRFNSDFDLQRFKAFKKEQTINERPRFSRPKNTHVQDTNSSGQLSYPSRVFRRNS